MVVELGQRAEGNGEVLAVEMQEVRGRARAREAVEEGPAGAVGLLGQADDRPRQFLGTEGVKTPGETGGLESTQEAGSRPVAELCQPADGIGEVDRVEGLEAAG